jgi:hypothetical protein
MSGRLRLVVFFSLVAMTLLACEGDVALARDFVQQWALDHAVEIAKEKAGVGTGDPYVEAAVEGYDAVKGIKEADELMDEARQKQDAKKMDEALERRPRDWSYQLSRGDLALERGDLATWDKYFGKSVNEAGLDNPHWSQQELDELSAAEERLRRAHDVDAPPELVFTSYRQCTELYDRLVKQTAQGYRPAGSPFDAAQARIVYEQRRAGCDAMAH